MCVAERFFNHNVRSSLTVDPKLYIIQLIEIKKDIITGFGIDLNCHMITESCFQQLVALIDFKAKLVKIISIRYIITLTMNVTELQCFAGFTSGHSIVKKILPRSIPVIHQYKIDLGNVLFPFRIEGNSTVDGSIVKIKGFRSLGICIPTVKNLTVAYRVFGFFRIATILNLLGRYVCKSFGIKGDIHG